MNLRSAIIWGWRRRRKSPEPPQGVRILHGDGRVSECFVILDPSIPGGLDWWMIVPPNGIEFDPEAGDAINVDAMPGRTMLYVSAPMEESGTWGRS